MSLLKPSRFCIVCGTAVVGRTDKVFCSVQCKSKYHMTRKEQRAPVSFPVDTMLHRNWAILTEAYELAGTRKFFINAATIQKEGFKPDYHTSIRQNRTGKQYHYIYDFAWMQFSEKELMVIKLRKSR